ncbi:MAG: class II fructose-bisphosphatase [Acidobacteriota bacterium]|nr:class II fructose-bisphosphatase [Acidobacteriota bacterium]
MTIDSALELGFVRVTELAAVAAAHTMGLGDRKGSDRVAVEAMREELGKMPMAGRVVIGEGERDKAPMLYVGEEVGGLKEGEGPMIDIAVDPLEGTNLCATGEPGAIAVLAASETGGLLHAPDIYMDKIVVGPTARKAPIHLDAPVSENLRHLADAFGREINELTIVVLERERHERLIADIRQAGARIRLIGDGDLSAGIAAAVRGTEIHAVMGIGGAPEGVITAAAMRCLGGEIFARLKPIGDDQKQRVADLGLSENIDALLTREDLAPGNNLLFCSTGVTGGQLQRGVRFFGGGYRTSTLFMVLHRKIIRFIDTIHRQDLESSVIFQ